jgi:hypothetical protein
MRCCLTLARRYNCLVIHAKLMQSTIVISGSFFHSVACAQHSPRLSSTEASRSYSVGGRVFSLDDIEHGILRCNKIHPTSGLVAFRSDDARLPFALPAPLDPRIHFALNCGARSCPAIRACDCTQPLLPRSLPQPTRRSLQVQQQQLEPRTGHGGEVVLQPACAGGGCGGMEGVSRRARDSEWSTRKTGAFENFLLVRSFFCLSSWP